MWARAVAVWLLVMAIEFVHGTLRWILLRPHVGDFRSGQIGVFFGSALLLLLVYFCAPWNDGVSDWAYSLLEPVPALQREFYGLCDRIAIVS